MVRNEGRIHEIPFDLFLKGCVENSTDAVPIFIGNADFVGHGARLGDRRRAQEVLAGSFPYGIVHRDAANICQVYRFAVVSDFRRPQNIFRRRKDDFFRKIHHIAVIGVGLIKLDGSKFGVVPDVHAFVSEHSSNFINTLQPPHDEALQSQLRSDAQIEVDIKSIMVGDKGLSRRAARQSR